MLPFTRHYSRILVGAAVAAAAAAVTAPVWGWRALRYYERRRREEVEAQRPVQTRADGVGPLYVRRYTVTVEAPRQSARALMGAVMANPNAFVPDGLATFEKTRGREGCLEEGDEFYIHIRGPWNGPVRAVEVTPQAFTLATLDGHLEAGRIRFSAEERGRMLSIAVVSCARSSDRVVDVFYDKLGLVRKAQAVMWTQFCTRVAEESGGTPGDINIDTWSGPGEASPWREADWVPYEDRLGRIPALSYNYDLDLLQREGLPDGWYDDAYEVALPPEPPGPPIEDGPWEEARAFVEAYRFPDPRLVRGIYNPSAPLSERAMVLEAHFLGFSFTFDVRIEAVIDEVRTTEEGPAHVWGYSYRTLEGHYERGEMFFEVWKYADTGRVAFKVHARSSPAPISNPLHRIGFRLFGRPLQRRFAHQATERVAEHVRGVLARQTCREL